MSTHCVLEKNLDIGHTNASYNYDEIQKKVKLFQIGIDFRDFRLSLQPLHQ